METQTLVILFASVGAIVALSTLAYVMLAGAKGGTKLSGLMANGPSNVGNFGQESQVDLSIEKIKRQSGSAELKERHEGLDSKLFRAGYYTEADKQWFRKFRVVAMIASPLLCFVFMISFSPNKMMVLLVTGIGVLIGLILPGAWLDRQIGKREEEILYYLPLVIEQISIGVSSALDIGPCISHIVSMADERDSHNPVTEMLIHTERLIRSGLNLEDSLVEVAEVSRMTEVKHAFMFLAQCSKYGGEISRQLQELADAVMTQRQVVVEGRITALPVKATGPLTVVFAGFFALLFAGIMVRLMGAFG
jgi:Flp pilus assembly protein TadB